MCTCGHVCKQCPHGTAVHEECLAVHESVVPLCCHDVVMIVFSMSQYKQIPLHTCCDGDVYNCGSLATGSLHQASSCLFTTILPMQPRACRYKSWSEAVGKATASVAVLYSSDYGYSDRLSQTLARGITKAGAATEMVDVLSVDVQVWLQPALAGLSHA